MPYLYDLLILHPFCLLAEIHFQTIFPEEGKAEGFREYGKNFCTGMISHMPGKFVDHTLLFLFSVLSSFEHA